MIEDCFDTDSLHYTLYLKEYYKGKWSGMSYIKDGKASESGNTAPEFEKYCGMELKKLCKTSSEYVWRKQNTKRVRIQY